MLRSRVRELNLASPPQVLQLEMGDTCRVISYLDYVGTGVSGTIYVAIGNKGVTFDELVKNSAAVSIPSTPSKKTYQATVDIPIVSPMKVATGYDLYAKVINTPGPDVYSPIYENVIDVVEEAAPPPPEQYTLTVRVSPSGTGSVTKSPDQATYTPGTLVVVTAVPNSGYNFDHWEGDESGSSKIIGVRMDRNKSVTAVFKQEVPAEEYYTITPYSIPSEGGYFYVEPLLIKYKKYDVVTVSAVAYTGWTLDYWLVNGTRYTGWKISVTILKDTIIEAHWRRQ